MEMNTNRKGKAKAEEMESSVSINPLRAEKVIVKFVPSKGGVFSDNKRHALYGGLAESSKVRFCVPLLASTGGYKNVLTNSEKDFLEDKLGLEVNALSVYRKVENYWDTYSVEVGKDGMRLDLSDPEDYIKYKVLLANDAMVAPDLETLQDRPKNTYRFVLVKADEENRLGSDKMDTTMACFKEYGKIENDIDTLRVLIEILDGRPYAQNSKMDFLRSRALVLIQNDPKKFLANITDPMLHTKMILRRSVELGKVSRKGDYYYLKADGSPLCETGQDPTLSVAARWLNLPSNSDVKALLDAEVMKARV